jgi:serine/threonine-protein kinase ATR
VPFRLTHNLVDAMGVTGYEGIFRKAGEVTTRLLRANIDMLMSVMESFIHDPLVEWNSKKVISGGSGADFVEN